MDYLFFIFALFANTGKIWPCYTTVQYYRINLKILLITLCIPYGTYCSKVDVKLKVYTHTNLYTVYIVTVIIYLTWIYLPLHLLSAMTKFLKHEQLFCKIRRATKQNREVYSGTVLRRGNHALFYVFWHLQFWV